MFLTDAVQSAIDQPSNAHGPQHRRFHRSILACAAGAESGDILGKGPAAKEALIAEATCARVTQPGGILREGPAAETALGAVFARARVAQPGDLPREGPATGAALRLKGRRMMMDVNVGVRLNSLRHLRITTQC